MGGDGLQLGLQRGLEMSSGARELSGVVTPLPFRSSLTPEFLALFAQEDEDEDLSWGEREID